MSSFKVALLQLMPKNNRADNLEKGLKACVDAHRLGADLILYPEMWQIGYDSQKMQSEYAIDTDSNFIQQHIQLAKTYRLAIALTYLAQGNPNPTNALALIDNTGNLVFEYHKVHICDFETGTETSLSAGTEFIVAPLNTKIGPINVGAMICFDREFPESARTLMLKGAELIITPNACQLHDCPVFGDSRLAAFQASAFYNLVAVAMTNYPTPKNDGYSCAYDAYGQRLTPIETGEHIVIADFDMDKIRNQRQQEQSVRGAPRRRTAAYQLT